MRCQATQASPVGATVPGSHLADRSRRTEALWFFVPLLILAYFARVVFDAASISPVPLTPSDHSSLSMGPFMIGFMLLVGSVLLGTAWIGWHRDRQKEMALERSPVISEVSSPSTPWRDYLALTKPRLNGLVMASNFVGFSMASTGALNVGLCLRTMLGTVLVAAGGSALNQVLERDIDSRMARTAQLPMAARHVGVGPGYAFGVGLSLSGMIILVVMVNLVAAFLATLTLVIYLFLYTPLKQIHPLATLVGAISGALPPVIGWVGAGGALDPRAQALFFILFLWQIPHFLAIAWRYRAQYGAAGFKMLSVFDPDGRTTSRQALLYCVALAAVSLAPTSLGLTGSVYLIAAALGGLAMMWFGMVFSRQRTERAARNLFLASITYLPLLLIVMLIDKTG